MSRTDGCASWFAQTSLYIHLLLGIFANCHAFLCMNSWALVTQVTNVQNIDIRSNLAMNLYLKQQARQIIVCPTKIGP